ncbi:MAG: ferrous iron transport protein B, partial [Planctomycetota bacterium]
MTSDRDSENVSANQITVALAGNPNSGKTTVFNALAGTRQHVGNYPGVTVEKKESRFKYEGREVRLIDLPGTYSLTAYSVEERVARDYVINENPDVVVDVVDASNLERNLYLAVQFMELGTPLILALNMSDVAEARGFDIDTERLSELLGVKIVSTVGHREEGMEELRAAIAEVGGRKNPQKPTVVTYGEEIERELHRCIPLLQDEDKLRDQYNSRWLALKLLEQDDEVRADVEEKARNPEKIFDAVEQSDHRIKRDFGEDPEVAIADQRYGFISGACQESVRQTVETRHTMSDRIDRVVTSRILGIPFFLGLMYLVFKLTFTVSEPMMEWTEMFFGWLGNNVAALWPAGSESVLQSLIVDGLIGGVGGVLVFFPVILMLFLSISLLEASGYMARAAFIMDRFMHKIGLHGRSFIPMLLGFGCTVPAIMATRTMESRRDRLTTMLVLPLISCGARLPIYALFIPAFFPEGQRTPILWGIYLIGIVLAVLLAKLLRSTLFKGEVAPFVMELPPYRMPTLKGTIIHMWERAWLFLRKAGTVIVGISILLWAMTSYPKLPNDEVQDLTE